MSKRPELLFHNSAVTCQDVNCFFWTIGNPLCWHILGSAAFAIKMENVSGRKKGQKFTSFSFC